MAPKRILLLSNPRSGSTLLANYLKSHPSIKLAHELLNDEEIIPEKFVNPLDYVEHHLQALADDNPEATVIGFKVFPEQIYARGLKFDQLILHLGITHVVVLWRSSLLETFVSMEIANATGVWYSLDEPCEINSARVDPAKFEDYQQDLVNDWKLIGQQWPVHVVPIYVEYESLIADTPDTCNNILYQLSCSQTGYKLYAFCKRQNPAPLSEKVTNWTELQSTHPTLVTASLNVQSLLEPLLNANLKIPTELLQFVPDCEPPAPVDGWTYRVAEPYISKSIKQNVYEAMESGIVSSAGCWAGRLSQRLKNLYGVPVAQPCSNGFTSIVLALQAVGLRPEDEVIVPSLTMIAVANAVSYTGAKVVFADSASDNYNPTWEQNLSASSPNTKAVIVTHTYGVPTPGIQQISKECKERGWWLIEDVSECVGIQILVEGEDEPRLLGTFGDFACASLYANKIVHAGDGGFVIAQNPVFGERLKSLANHGFTPSYHFVHFDVAMNAKINGVGAAMAVGCIDELRHVMKHRAELAQDYRNFLRNNIGQHLLGLMPECGFGDTPWVFGVECNSKTERTKLRAWLAQFGIETRDYFFPLHLQPAYNQNQDTSEWRRLPNAERYGSTCFYLPTFTSMKREDISYICSVIQKYFNRASGCGENTNDGEEGKDNGQKLASLPERLEKAPTRSIFIDSETFDIGVRTFNQSSGQFQPDENWGKINNRGHPYKRALKLLLELEEVLVLESWAKQQMLIHEINDLIDITTNKDMKTKIQSLFQKHVNYFQSQSKYEELQHVQRPWLEEDLSDPIYKTALQIPTTTDSETLQLLVWLVKHRNAATIWEIGAWFGHATARLTAAAKNVGQSAKVYACDVFQWQKWMKRYLTKADESSCKFSAGASFLPKFEANLTEFEDCVHPVIWPYTITSLPEELANSSTPDLVFIDLTQEESELEFVWSLIQPKLVSRNTVVVVNGFVSKSLPFFTRHADCLIPFAKPNTIAKAFLYVDEKEDEFTDLTATTTNQATCQALERKLRFASSPGWTHHHHNAFGHSIELLKAELHSPTATTVFIPAVEETLCDEPEILVKQPWIGIIHSVRTHPEYFYTPDLTRLCSPEFHAAMSKCKGLFTLTSYQAEYLSENLKKTLGYSIPIQSLTYPMITDHLPPITSSTVIQDWKSSSQISLLLIGSFARDFDLFYDCSVPANLIKTVLVGDETIQAEVDKREAQNREQNVKLLRRLDDIEYESALQRSIVFLPLKYDGAANTTILECIARNIPIVVPDLSSCTEYIGEDYPLIYTQGSNDLTQLITLERVQAAVDYLQAMDKSKFSTSTFIQTVKSSAVLLAVNPEETTVPTTVGVDTNFDVTISICSYKRTHHLPKILDALWNQQDFTGTMQIIVWNNNAERSEIVHHECRKYLRSSSRTRSLEMIDSTNNYYCTVRLALAHLMKGSALLICDDDIIPSSNFVSFFMAAHAKYPSNVLCTRGHVFHPHELDVTNATNVWANYEHLRFKSDEAPEQFIHFVHADTCLIPKTALLEASSIELPDPTFALVDDYWMSFILNSKFERQLRKLTTKGLKQLPFERTADGENTAGLALHTRPEVKDAKLRLYIHHKLQGWPAGDENAEYIMTPEYVEKKKSFWKTQAPFIGYNVSSRLSPADIAKLVELGVKVVRIGAVGMGGGNGVSGFPYEFDQLNDNPYRQVEKLATVVGLLQEAGIYVVVTTSKLLATPLNWSIIARGLRRFANVIGYDLVNEPFLSSELEMHRSELANIQPNGIPSEMAAYIDLMKSVRELDSATPIVIEPSFWGHLDALRLLPIQVFLQRDSNVVVSFHFYEPRLITQRTKNGGRFKFPGDVPIFDNVKYPDTIYWDAAQIKAQLTRAVEWAKHHNVAIFLGEFGICRDIAGSAQYLEAIMTSCRELRLSGFVYSFRDKYWDAMNYEFGANASNYFFLDKGDEGHEGEMNELMKVVREGIRSMNE